MEKPIIELEYDGPVRSARARAIGLTNRTLQTLAIAAMAIVALTVLAIFMLV